MRTKHRKQWPRDPQTKLVLAMSGKPRSFKRFQHEVKQEKTMRGIGKQGKAIKSKIHNRITQKKMPKNSQSSEARKSKGSQGNDGQSKGNIEKPEKAIDRFARGARFARLPGCLEIFNAFATNLEKK